MMNIDVKAADGTEFGCGNNGDVQSRRELGVGWPLSVLIGLGDEVKYVNIIDEWDATM